MGTTKVGVTVVPPIVGEGEVVVDPCSVFWSPSSVLVVLPLATGTGADLSALMSSTTAMATIVITTRTTVGRRIVRGYRAVRLLRDA